MKRWIPPVIIAIVIAVIGFALWHANAATPASQPQVASVLYPLYNGVDWNAPTAYSFTMGTTTFTGLNATSSAVSGTMDPSSVFMPFLQYYSGKLAAAGWSVDNSFDAGGPTGALGGYRKGSQIILVNYSIAYPNVQNTGPLQCPCDVSFSLFSGDQ